MTVKVTTATAETALTVSSAKDTGVPEDCNENGVPRSRIAELAVGDEILIGPDFYATITVVHDGKFDIVNEHGRPMRINPAAIWALP
jgi:hypothetical protein